MCNFNGLQKHCSNSWW